MLQPLTIANKTFPINMIQGPLAGISCAPFRYLLWQYSQPAFACTEMISCKTLLHQAELARRRLIAKDPQEGPLCFQLSANNPLELAEATKKATDYGADLIDLNCGCPVKKIRSKGAGSSLLTDAGKLYKLITAMKQNTHLPVSVKIRVQGDGAEKFNGEIAQVISDAGADVLVVHGRHWTEHYQTACRYEEIKFFVEQLKIPVIGNGDIACVESLKRMLATGCAGVMIGRAGVGQPWLIAKLRAELSHTAFAMPALAEQGTVFMEHVQRLAILLASEKFAILQARKFAKYYARNLKMKTEFSQAVNNCATLTDLSAICLRYFVN